jgi:tetratricopeptide (TPR) repeat protein
VSALRAVLDASPGDVESLEFLDRIFSREGQNPELLEVLDQRVAVEADPVQRDALAVRAARLLEDELSDVDGAIGRYREVLERTPAHPEARAALSQIARGDDYRMPAIAALEPLLRAGAEWDQLVELLELKLAVEEGLGPRLEILSEIARIEELARRDPKKAFAAWARALAEDPSDAEPREALERLAAVGASWARLAEVYVERLEGTYDSGLQRTLAVRLGELHEGPLSDAERALDFYRKALDAGGDEAPVLMALERVLRQLGRDAELAEVLARRAEVVSDPAAEAELLVQLGQVRLGRLDDVDGALSAFRDALERAPDHVGARAALRDLLRLPAARDSALDVLEPLAESRGDWSELVSLYEHRLETRDDKLERANWLRRIAELYDERLGQPALALDALGRALTEEPTPGETVDALERLASGDHELALRAARLYETSPASRGAAERLYTRVLEDDPENVDALASLETFHRGSGERAGLATVLERRATLDLDPTVRRGRLAEAARLREALGDVTAALADWQLLREAEEGDAEVLGEMARLFEGQGKLDELAEVLAERARFESDGAVRAALLGRIGDLKMGPLEDLEGAADAFREALDVAPDDPRLLGALEQIEERREDWSTLQEVLLRRMGAVGDGPAQIPVLFRLAKNADERLSDIDQAVGFLHQVLAIEEANGMAFLELERILRANERWYDLVDVLGKHADNEAAAGHKPTELALRVAIADVWEKQLDSADSAAEALEKVLEVSPQHVGALLSLARIHEAAERWEQATEALEGAAAATSGGMDAAEIHYRTAQIKKAQGAESQELEPIYVRALQADRRHALSLKALEEIARAASDSQRLAQLLELRLDATTAPLERKPLLAEIATLQRTTFGNPAGAVPYLEQLAALAPDDAAVSEDLAEALTAAGRSDDAARILERLVEQLTKARRGKEVAKHLQRLGGIAEAKGDRLGALERYTAAYKLDPGHAGTLAALGRLALTQKDLEGARRYYRSLLLQNFDEKTAGITKAGVYLALGRIHLDAGEDAKARNMFERGLEADPKSEDLKTALAAVPR